MSSESSGETAHLHRLVGAFAADTCGITNILRGDSSFYVTLKEPEKDHLKMQSA